MDNHFAKTASKALNISVSFWFLIAILGQWFFAYYIAITYGETAISGQLEKWDEVLFFGFIDGDWIGNTILIAHIFLATRIIARFYFYQNRKSTRKNYAPRHYLHRRHARLSTHSYHR